MSVVASADGRRSRFETGEVLTGEIVHARLRFKASHAELVLMTCDVGVDGWADNAAG